INRLRCKICERQTVPWPQLLKEVVDEYNKAPYEVAGYAPCYLLLGTPSYPELLPSNKPLNISRVKVVENSLRYHCKNKIIYDQKFVPIDFKAGDQVMIERIW